MLFNRNKNRKKKKNFLNRYYDKFRHSCAVGHTEHTVATQMVMRYPHSGPGEAVEVPLDVFLDVPSHAVSMPHCELSLYPVALCATCLSV